MRDKFKRLFSGRSLGAGTTEISGSAGGNNSFRDSLLANNDDDNWDAWSVGKDITGDKGRGRTDRRAGNQRSQSERPSRRKRSKSEVNKRLKRLEGDMTFGQEKSTTLRSGNRSTGGVFRGDRSEIQSKIDYLALERSSLSESRTVIDDTAVPTSKPTKKLRGGRRKSTIDDINVSSSGDGAVRRSRSVSRSRRASTKNIGDAAPRVRASSKKAKRRSSSKARFSKAMTEFPDILPDIENERNSSSTVTTKDSTTKDSKKKKKKKSDKEKKKRNKTQSDDSSSQYSVPSNVEMNNDCESYGSVTIPESPKAKKKKVKDKTKKPKKNKSKDDFPSLPLDDFGDGLEGLAEEFRRSKKGYVDEKSEPFVSASTCVSEISNTENNNYTKVSSMFENAWTGMGKSKGTANDEVQEEKKRLSPFATGDLQNPFVNNNGTNPFATDNGTSHINEDDLLRQAVDFQVTQTENSNQQEQILKLQQQLSTALQKQVTMSEEHIQDKDEFLQISRELERVKVELAESLEEHGEAMEELKERDRIIEDDRSRIVNLEEAIGKQLGKEEELEKNACQSEEEIEKLLDVIQNFENNLENGENSDGRASFVELRSTKKLLSEKEEIVVSQKSRIEELEKELKDSLTVPQLQIEELDQEKKAMQGRLKGERLEYTSKLSAKDVIISNIRTELLSYTVSSDAQDLQSARQKLNEAREDATTVREDLVAARKIIEKLHEEREDLLEQYSLQKENSVFMEKSMKELTEKSDNLRAKVLEWTEKTYDWKQKAESAERKLEAYNEEKDKAASDKGDSVASEDFADEAPQGLFLHAAMEKGKRSSGASNRSSSWGIFKNSAENQELSAEEIRIRILEEQNHDYEAKIAELSSKLVKIQTVHKEEMYARKKKIAQLEGEMALLET